MNRQEIEKTIQKIISSHATQEHQNNDYFKAIKLLVEQRKQADKEEYPLWQAAIEKVYEKIKDEIISNTSKPVNPIKFGTSGWRGILGKDIFVKSAATVTAAILSLYEEAESNPELSELLQVDNFSDMQEKGCVLGFDSRFGAEIIARAVAGVLHENGVHIYYAGESTTGALSACVLEREAAFSINLTPSHNPLEYGGFKFNAADAGPAAPQLTNIITRHAQEILENGSKYLPEDTKLQQPIEHLKNVTRENCLVSWQDLVRKNKNRHGLDYDNILQELAQKDNIIIVVDCLHGASRRYIQHLLTGAGSKLHLLRTSDDPTFNNIAPEPSRENIQGVISYLQNRDEQYKIGAIIDPDGDRIRFTDGNRDISMNQFGAMSYHFLHEYKKKKGMVAKTVATSNLANAIAHKLKENIFEPRVGFKEFKPVIDRALVFFEESDGISIIGHTPEKDAFIGLILAMDMVIGSKKNLSEYLSDIESEYGQFFPEKDAIVVRKEGDDLISSLAQLDKYKKGSRIKVGTDLKRIKEVITIDGYKFIFEDDSWLMIRPSGTEPKVRFYVEARNQAETRFLIETAKTMLAEIGIDY